MGKKDPITNFENHLLSKNILNEQLIKSIKNDIKNDIQQGLDIAFNEGSISFEEKSFMEDVYSPFNFKAIKSGVTTSYIRFIDAIQDGLKEAMSVFDNTIIMGQGIAEYGGAFKVTEGFVELFGNDRVRNTPICESGIVETAMGLSIGGFKAIVEMQFADFVSSGFNPIVNYLAKNHFRWGEKADVVIRMPCGAGVGAGPFHSQTNEAWFTKTPGLKGGLSCFPNGC